MTDDPLAATRAALGERPAWLVGGAVRDRLLGRATSDYDVVLAGDAREPARAVASAARGAAFPLSETFGGWRVVGPAHAWHVDLVPLREGSLEADLDARDFTVNALAEPLAGGELVDRHGGRRDVGERRLRLVSEGALRDDPLRVMRLVRHACELGFEADAGALAAARAAAGTLDRVAPERVFAELRRIVASDVAPEGMRLALELGALAAWLPELERLRGVEQGRSHRFDVWEHTLVVLDHVCELDAPERERAAGAAVLETDLGEHAPAVRALLAEPLADELTRGTALRLAALLHDVAKPDTRRARGGGAVGFPGHDVQGTRVARDVLRRLRTSERLCEHVAAIVRWHLRAVPLFYGPPVDRRAIFGYLRDCGDVAADVALLSLADRRGGDTAEDLADYHALLRRLLGEALERRSVGPPPPLVRGDELARELDRPSGPWLGELLAALEEDRFAGEIATREQALARARELARGQFG